MSTKTVEFKPPQPDQGSGPKPPPEPEWDGTRTRFTLANTPALKHGPRTDAGDPTGELLLLKSGDQVEYRASLVAAKWVGPDAGEVRAHIAGGRIAGTPEAAALAREIANVESERGVYGGGEDGEPLRPELRFPDDGSLFDVGGRWSLRRNTEGGLEAAVQRERREANASRAERDQVAEGAMRRLAGLAGLDPEALARLADAAAREGDQAG